MVKAYLAQHRAAVRMWYCIDRQAALALRPRRVHYAGRQSHPFHVLKLRHMLKLPR